MNANALMLFISDNLLYSLGRVQLGYEDLESAIAIAVTGSLTLLKYMQCMAEELSWLTVTG